LEAPGGIWRHLLLIGIIGKDQKKFSPQPPEGRKEPATLNLDHEPYHISPRFYQALQAKALSLENDAQKDEVFASTLDNPGHRERHNRLIQAQRDQARRLRDFLAASEIHVA
jgi:hypothetical protein